MSRGGSRYSAGRPARHAKTFGKHQIDVRQVARWGHLSNEQNLTLKWADGSTIGMNTSRHNVTLIYRYWDREGHWHDVNQFIHIEHTRCHYGNTRPWFNCPRCCRRVAILYLWNVPRCRKCARLVYLSQSVDALGRSWRRTSKIERKLATGAGEWNHLRPKGMRKATYRKLLDARFKEEEWREAEFMAAWQRWAPDLWE